MYWHLCAVLDHLQSALLCQLHLAPGSFLAILSVYQERCAVFATEFYSDEELFYATCAKCCKLEIVEFDMSDG